MRTLQDIQKLTDRELRSELGQLLPNVSLGKQMRLPNYPKNRNATYKAIDHIDPQLAPRLSFELRARVGAPLSARVEAECLLLILQSD